ncbi:hypothetical protein VTL71DRAFT_5687 [Oculimacula yallundae]|uniref:Uncharacterized protein n=1 Tax=Oculimacula yallundae TaxID=86028 RepID=A0ABR4BYC4_9HELO
MPNQSSLSAAMDKLRLGQCAPTPPPLPSRPVQSSGMRYTESSILGQWGDDRFGEDTSSVSGGSGQQRQCKSTPSEWRSYAQSNTSKPLPTSRTRDGGSTNEGAWRRENWRTGVRNNSSGLAGPVLPTLPTTPSQGQPQTPRSTPALPISLPRSPARDLISSQPIPQDQALRKRKSERYIGQNGDIAEEPYHKRASPNRPSPSSVAVIALENGNNKAFDPAGILPLARRPSFERWVSTQTRPQFVAPNGTTIIPLQARTKSQQEETLRSASTQMTVQPELNPTPAVQPRPSSRNETSTTPQTQSQSFNLPLKPLPSTNTSTPALQPRASSRNETPPTSQPQPSNLPPRPTTTPILSATPFIPVATVPSSQTPTPPKSRPKTSDEMARRIIFAGIGAGRVPKRTPEEIKKREEELEQRRLQREERESMGPEEVMRWYNTPTKVWNRPVEQVGGNAGKELIQSDTAKL